ncbi:hypothetical protein C464_08190 [Halorubrum coriense DSM 10284]|uniref:Uncharacterized protein n=2 Tax=Halorubrum coriense TaxID=64713 RepID=M0EJC5_9EURY|nr:hypothetical protein C464_08190 [Halorubrum coriense DSM 10284]
MRYVAIFSVVIVTIGLGLGMAAGLGAAQSTSPAPNSTAVDAPGEDIESIEYQLDSVDIASVEYRNSTAIVTARYNEPSTVTLTDSGAVKGLGSDDGARVSFQSYSKGEGVYELRLPLRGDDELITIQQGGVMFADSGDRALIDIITNPADTQTVQSGALGGGFGVLLASAFGAGMKKRKHENTYKELTSEERISVESNPVAGFWGSVKRWFSNHRIALVAIAGILAYLLAVRVGVVPSPASFWDTLNDVQRVFAASTLALIVFGFIPAYVVLDRLWDPATEFVLELDDRDVLDAGIGADGGLARIEAADDIDDVADKLEGIEDATITAIYSGSPDRVSQMNVDGEPAEIRVPGGRAVIVNEFDPQRNVARGCWVGTANDAEIIAERSKIDANKEILRDESRMFRTLVGALPAIATSSDTQAMAAVDKELRQMATVDSGAIDGLLDRASQGTRFEGQYTDTDEDDESDDEGGLADLIDPRDGDEDDDKEDDN